MDTFVVCGESLFDVFLSGATPMGLAMDARMGGSPFNVAIGLARLGRAVEFVGGVGRDGAAERILRGLAEEGVGTRHAPRVEAPTSLMLVGLDAAGVPTYTFYGRGGADHQVRTEHLAAVPAGAAAYHFGSYSTVVQPTGETQRALVERERGRGLISYDPNVRLRVEPRRETWQEMFLWMRTRAHLLKVSAEDLELLFPGVPEETCAREALSAGVRLFVVTRESRGAAGFTRSARAEVPAVGVSVKDTVGAGDSFQAALLAWLSETGRLRPDALAALTTAELTAALAFAGRAAAITCSRRGADMPRRAELGPRT